MLIPSPANLSNQRLAVLGGCGGIGRHLVERAVALGLQVAVLDLAVSLERHPVPETVLALAVDACDQHTLAHAFGQLEQRWQGLDGFVNLCGFMHDNQAASDISVSTWQTIIEGNLNSVLLAAQCALALLKKSDQASIVHAASGLAQFIRPGFGAYSAAKAGVIALTKTLALENAPQVRVNAVAPSAVDTAFLRGGTGRSDENQAPHLDMQAYIANIPMQRIAQAEDVVGPILFLLSEQSRYMTGQVLWINGGSYMP